MPNSIYAVFVSYNPQSSFVQNVQSLLDQGARVILVDNGSDAESLANLRAFDQDRQVITILNQNNLGIATALNQGIREALALGADWLFTFDQDSLAPHNFVEAMTTAWAELEAQGVPLGCLGPSWGLSVSREKEELKGSDYSFPDYLISSGMLIRNSLVREIGFFRDDYFIDYVDVEFCLRCRDHRLQIAQFAGVQLVHHLGNTQEHLFIGNKIQATHHNYIRRYYITRNRIFTWKTYARKYPRWFSGDLWAFFSETAKILMVESDKKRKIQSIITGVRDALRGRSGRYI